MFEALVLLAFSAGCQQHPLGEQAFAIPKQDEWSDCGEVFTAGKNGEWDHLLWGGFALAAVKVNGRYALYYQGSRGYDEPGGTVAWRAVGVALSNDGFRFTKSPDNPVLTWFPKQNLEEGATSAAPFLDEAGRVVVYYGANTWAGSDRIHASARAAVSEDGVRFSDRGVVLAHDDDRVWGARDELFPIMAVGEGTRRWIYYIPNGSLEAGQLGVAWEDASGFVRSGPVRSGGRLLPAWSAGSAVSIGPRTYAMFLMRGRGDGARPIEARLVSLDAPDRFSPPLETYSWPDVAVATVLLDEDRGRWFMYTRDPAHQAYRVRVAHARAPDASPDRRGSVVEPEVTGPEPSCT